MSETPTQDVNTLYACVPALTDFIIHELEGDRWQRDKLSARDRSLVTVAALVSRGHGRELDRQLARALDNGVTAAELSETFNHLAFYAGLAEVSTCLPALDELFTARGVAAGDLPPAKADLLPIDEEAEAKRAATVAENVEPTAPTLATDTGEVLFQNLWLRPALAPRDRSLVTVAALIATGQAAQVTFHLNKALGNGLTQDEAAEVLGHLPYYVGWPKAMSAVGVFKDVFADR